MSVLMITLYVFLEGRPQVNCCIHRILSSVHMINIVITVDVDLGPLAAVVCARLSVPELLLFPCLHIALFGMKSLCAATPKEWGSVPLLLGGEISTCITWKSAAQEICHLSHLFS